MSRYDYTYYTCLINNHDSKHTPSTIEPALQFNEDRNYPIITNTADYDMAITNFKLDTKTVPSFIPVIKYNASPTQEQKFETIYEITFTLRTNGKRFGHTEPVIFKPQDLSLSVPDFKNGYADYKSGFYNIYNYENFFTSVNEALRQCLMGLRDTINAAFPDMNNGHYFEENFSNNLVDLFPVPYFIFDKDSSLAYVNAPVLYFGSDMKIQINLNTPLYRLFDSLPFDFHETTYINNSNETVVVKLFKMNLENFFNSNIVSLYPKHLYDQGITPTTKKVDHYIVYQDYETLTSWSPVESIVLTSNTLPIKPSIVSQNHSYVEGKETTEGSTNIIEMELSDFRAGNCKPGIIFEPKNLRWINMLDMDELKHINFQVFYRLKVDGGLIPLKINSGGNFGLKLCFRKLKK